MRRLTRLKMAREHNRPRQEIQRRREQDDGRATARRILGRKLPNLTLPTPETAISVAALARLHSLVVCFYPVLAVTQEPEQDPNMMRALRWLQHEDTLRALGHVLVAVTSQSVESQLEWAYQLDVHHPILSDSDLLLARTLALPTSQTYRRLAPWVYQPATIVLRGERVVHVHYPADVDDAAATTDWLRRRYGD